MQAGHLSSALTVALLVSAWIETSVIPTVGAKLPSSHSSWVRGLKLTLYMLALSQNRRTPRECVDWNNFRFDETTSSTVALLVSAWIETSFGLTKSQTTLSHSSWVRGLKHARLPFQSGSSVALLVSAWIETINSVLIWPPLMSRTPRECVDWNSIALASASEIMPSHSSWVRGLKQPIADELNSLGQSRTPRECVDWNIKYISKKYNSIGRTPRECVDWNIEYFFLPNILLQVALLVSAWIETGCYVLIFCLLSRTPRECVDWNYITLLTIIRKKVALLVSAWIETYHNSRQNNISCRTPRECVDWNKVWTYKAIWWNCRTPRECVDWNK